MMMAERAAPDERSAIPRGQGRDADRSRRRQRDEAQAVPQTPGDLPKSSWVTVLRRAVGEIKRDELTDRAAALTYYGVQAIFPGVLVLVSALGLVGQSTTNTLISNLGQIAPGSASSIIQTTITNAQNQKSLAGLAGILGLLLALWSASAYVSAYMRSANAIYGIGEGRPIWKTAPVRLFITLALVIGLVAGLVIVVTTGSVAKQVGTVLGVGSSATTVWEIAKWPVLLLIFTTLLAILYKASPNVRLGGVRWVSPGSALAVVIWLIASGLFAFYVANFGSYNKTYGALAGVIIFLIWLWISNLAILLGTEFDAELDHERAIREGVSPDSDLFAIAQDTRKLDDDTAKEAKRTAATRARSRERQSYF
jgi:membrane protein